MTKQSNMFPVLKCAAVRNKAMHNLQNLKYYDIVLRARTEFIFKYIVKKV